MFRQVRFEKPEGLEYLPGQWVFLKSDMVRRPPAQPCLVAVARRLRRAREHRCPSTSCTPSRSPPVQTTPSSSATSRLSATGPASSTRSTTPATSAPPLSPLGCDMKTQEQNATFPSRIHSAPYRRVRRRWRRARRSTRSSPSPSRSRGRMAPRHRCPPTTSGVSGWCGARLFAHSTD